MSTTTAVTQADVEATNQKLYKLLLTHKGTNIMMRVSLFMQERTKKKLPEYIYDPAIPNQGKIAIIEELIGIAERQEWSKLPEVPRGQASANGTNGTKPSVATAAPRVTAPAPTPAAKPLTPAAPVEELDTPPYGAIDPEPAVESMPGAIGPTPVFTRGDEAADEADDDNPFADAAAIIAAQLKRLGAQPKGKPLTEADVRRIVRQELAHVFSTSAEVLNK